jgi:hypothetical protein
MTALTVASGQSVLVLGGSSPVSNTLQNKVLVGNIVFLGKYTTFTCANH